MRVRLARPAFEDLASRLDQVLARLAEQPGMGVRTDDPAVRRVVLRPYPYLAFYEAGEAEVVILAIRHGARDPRTMPGANPEGEAPP